MTGEQEQHLQQIKDEFGEAVERKYRAGAAEHGGNLWDKTPLQLCDEAIAEAIDQVTFLLTLRTKLAEQQAQQEG